MATPESVVSDVTTLSLTVSISDETGQDQGERADAGDPSLTIIDAETSVSFQEESLSPETPPKRTFWSRIKDFCCCRKKPVDDSITTRSDVKAGEEVRETWGSKLGYMLTLVGYAVGFGNVWRFPYLLQSNGGIAFLIPYIILLLAAGTPLFFLELAIGQRLKKGSVGSWNEISRYLGGIGISCGVICYYSVVYYNVLVAWVISYIVDSFRSNLPWTSCEYLYDLYKHKLTKSEITNGTFFTPVIKECMDAEQPSKYYWFRKTLDISESITDPGNFNWYMFLYISIAWATVALILIKGMKSSEKVVYFTSIFPYAALSIFFVANFFNEGWKRGYIVLLNPDFEKLLDPATWLIAGTQVFFSMGVACGCLTSFASYMPADNNCYKDAMIICGINLFTSMFATVVVFPVLGAQGTRAYKECLLLRKFEFLRMEQVLSDSDFAQGIAKLTKYVESRYLIPDIGGAGSLYNFDQVNSGPIYTYLARNEPKDQWVELRVAEGHSLNKTCDLDKLISSSGDGPGLVFIAFAEAAKHLPVPQLFCFIFFTMLWTLGIDSAFGTVEGVIAVIVDLKIVKWSRWVITLLICTSLWLLGIFFSFGWGQYVQVFLDQFTANWGLLIIAFVELVGISYVYGLAKFAYDIKLMTGRQPDLCMMLCWKIVTPLVLILIFVGTIVSEILKGYKYSRYVRKEGNLKEEKLPGWLLAMGFMFIFSIIFWIPLQAILCRFKLTLVKEEKSNYFPEEELRQERSMTKDDDVGDFNSLEQLVLGRSLEDLHKQRRESITKNESLHEEGAALLEREPSMLQ